MELTLSLQASTTVAVSCDEGPSHTFDLNRLLPGAKLAGPLDDPLKYGEAVYQALFPPKSLAARLLDSELKRPTSQRRLLLVAGGASLEAIPWEYARGTESWLVCDLPFVRGLPASERRPAPAVESGLHVVALASSPLGKDITPLNVEGEWQTLKEAFGRLEHAAVLERARPATIDELRRRVTGRKPFVVHFMGHGGQAVDGQFALFFEKDNGAPNPVRGRELVNRLGEAAFLVVMSACVSAASGATEFDNLAAALVKWGTPYALGMRFSIPDEDALLFARPFYDELAAGAPVEQAAWQARIKLQDSRQDWMVGVPVLYTALQAPAPGFACAEGTPQVKDPTPNIDLYTLPRPKGGLQGRIDELLWLGERLTGDQRARLLTILGVGGQGKSTLARQAAERFAWAWPGGVYAASLENLPRREDFNWTLAQFLGIETQAQDPNQDPKGFRKPLGSEEELEKRLLDTLARQRTLLVLDNAETLVDGLDSADAETAQRARELAEFLKKLLETPTVTLLATARRPLGWAGEETKDLEGLAPTEGAHLFRQCVPQRQGKVYNKEAEALSRKLEGHPLGLHLLGAAFNDSTLSLKEFIQDYDRQLLQAADKYKEVDARQRRLYTCLEASTHTLDNETRTLLAGLCIFEAPFLSEVAVQVFDPELPEGVHSKVLDQLQTLERLSLLEKNERILRDGTVELYRLAAAVRLYTSGYLHESRTDQGKDFNDGPGKASLPQAELQVRFGRACTKLVRVIFEELDRSARWVYVAQQCAPDLEQALTWVEKPEIGSYLTRWGWVIGRLGNPHRALELYEQALPITRAIGDRAGEAMTLVNLAFTLHHHLSRTAEAIPLVQQSIAILKEHHLSQDAAGQSMADHEAILAELQASLQPPAPPKAAPAAQKATPPATHQPPVAHLTTEQLQLIASNTLVALTTAPDKLPPWRIALRSNYQQAQRANAQAEIELFAALLALLDQVPPALSADNPYAGLVQTIQQALTHTHPLDAPEGIGLKAGGPWPGGLPEKAEGKSNLPPESPGAPDKQLDQAMRALLAAQDLPSLRRAIEKHQKQLFKPKALEFLDSLARASNQRGEQQARQVLAFYATLLQRCRQSGISAVFEELAQSAAPGAPAQDEELFEPASPPARAVTPTGAALPPDFVARCVEGLRGGKPEREALFNYLAGVPVGEPGCAALLKDLKLWLLGSNPKKLGQKLEGPYAAAWQEIISQV